MFVRRVAVHIIIGLLRAFALLWLVGHRFARRLVFLVLAVIGFAAGIALASISFNAPASATAICGIIGACLAWPLASIPIYYWQHRLRVLLDNQRSAI
jgi:hypothetical protein